MKKNDGWKNKEKRSKIKGKKKEKREDAGRIGKQTKNVTKKLS